MQGSSANLPLELWIRVLGHLSLKDLLAARLVSKNFVPISSLPNLSLCVGALSKGAMASLMLFLYRHFQQQLSPKLLLTIRNQDPKDSLNIPIILGSGCANLRELKVTACLGLDDAHSYLQVLPGSLEHLDVHVPAQMIEDTAWRHLQNLTSLKLRLNAPRYLKSGSALATLSSLRSLHLDLITSRDRGIINHIVCKRLEAAGFMHSTLTGLEVKMCLPTVSIWRGAYPA